MEKQKVNIGTRYTRYQHCLDGNIRAEEEGLGLKDCTKAEEYTRRDPHLNAKSDAIDSLMSYKALMYVMSCVGRVFWLIEIFGAIFVIAFGLHYFNICFPTIKTKTQ